MYSTLTSARTHIGLLLFFALVKAVAPAFCSHLISSLWEREKRPHRFTGFAQLRRFHDQESLALSVGSHRKALYALRAQRSNSASSRPAPG